MVGYLTTEEWNTLDSDTKLDELSPLNCAKRWTVTEGISKAQRKAKTDENKKKEDELKAKKKAAAGVKKITTTSTTTVKTLLK